MSLRKLLPPGLTGVLQQLRKRRDLSVTATDQDDADLTEKLEGSSAVYMVVPSAASPEADAFLAFLVKPGTHSLMHDAGMIVGK